MTAARAHAVSEWLAEMTNGGVPDQNWLALQKHFKGTADEPRKMTSAMEDKIASKFLRAVLDGGHATSQTGELFDQALQNALDRQQDELGGMTPPKADDGALRQVQAELDALRAQMEQGGGGQLAAVRERLRQANEWRFRLESACRRAHAELEQFLSVHQRAPSETELARVVARLEEGLL